MKRSRVVNIIVIAVCAYGICVNALPPEPEATEKPTTSTPDVQENTSCEVLLDFSNMGLKIINPNFISNPFIKTLALKNNDISYFQENTFHSLPSLAKLDLSNNQITTEKLFSFGSLYKLKSLILDNNPISYHKKRVDTSPYYYTCSQDEYYIGSSGCSTYSQLKVEYEYPELTHLSIRNIFIDSLASDWANHFPKLTHLDISDNYFHKSSEKVFSYLPMSVSSLTMQNAELTALTSLNLKNIIHLDLNNNQFETLSSHYCYENTLCLRNLTNLESLHISNCSIKKIEIDAFKDSNKLNYLNISNNHFEEIPDGTFEFLPALTQFDLSKNKLNILPAFSNLQNLRSLYMDDMQNNWIFIFYLEAFAQLPELKALSLRRNGLFQISSSFLDKFPKLEILDLSYNKMSTLPPWQWQNSLRELRLVDNKIKNFEDISLKEAESLQLLDMRKNKFDSIMVKSLKNLPDDVKLML